MACRLHKAAHNGHFELCRYLVGLGGWGVEGGGLAATDVRGATAAMAARARGHRELAGWLEAAAAGGKTNEETVATAAQEE